MTDYLPMAGKAPNNAAKAITTDEVGNLQIRLQARNELATYATNTVPAKGTRTMINRFEGLENYAAVKISVVASNQATLRVVANWYERTATNNPGLQVANLTLKDTAPILRFQSEYLEVGGNQLSIVLANTSDEDVSVTVFVRGIR